MSVDHFPSTHATWIERHVTLAERARGPGAGVREAAEARAALRAHLMERYYDALRTYVRTGALVGLGEPEEIVNDFLTRTVDDPRFLRRWIESGLPLRRWMMNAIAFHCRGMLRDRRRTDARETPGTEFARIAGAAADPARAFDRAWAVALAGEAFAVAQADAEERGRPNDALVFRMHALDGLPHAAIATQLGITESQSTNASKRVGARMREAVRDLLREEGVRAAEIDDAVAQVLALVEEAAGE